MLTKTKLLLILLTAVLIGWIFTKKGKYKHQLELEVRNLDPERLWTLMSNFKTLMTLNPTIISYTIVRENSKDQLNAEEKTLLETEFEVLYKEHLVYFPSVTHEATAMYRSYSKGQRQPFRIVSEHITHVLGSTLITFEETEFWAKETNEGHSTLMTSTVEYECLIVLSKYCEMEFKGQRSLVHSKIQDLGAKISN